MTRCSVLTSVKISFEFCWQRRSIQAFAWRRMFCLRKKHAITSCQLPLVFRLNAVALFQDYRRRSHVAMRCFEQRRLRPCRSEICLQFFTRPQQRSLVHVSQGLALGERAVEVISCERARTHDETDRTSFVCCVTFVRCAARPADLTKVCLRAYFAMILAVLEAFRGINNARRVTPTSLGLKQGSRSQRIRTKMHFKRCYNF